jgi:hypothetical protein
VGTHVGSWNDEALALRVLEKLTSKAPVNGGRNYNGPKVAKFLVELRPSQAFQHGSP